MILYTIYYNNHLLNLHCEKINSRNKAYADFVAAFGLYKYLVDIRTGGAGIKLILLKINETLSDG